MFILSMGLLGIASLHAVSLQDSTTAYKRSQAVLISEELTELLRNNPALLHYARTNNIRSNEDFRSYDGDGNILAGSCDSDEGCSPEQLAQEELVKWKKSLSRLGRKYAVGAQTHYIATVELIYLPSIEQFRLEVQWLSRKWKAANSRKLASSSYEFYVSID